MKKLLILLFLLNLLTGNSHSIEPDVFVQSTVNRASEILSKDISKEEKINQLKFKINGVFAREEANPASANQEEGPEAQGLQAVPGRQGRCAGHRQV